MINNSDTKDEKEEFKSKDTIYQDLYRKKQIIWIHLYLFKKIEPIVNILPIQKVQYPDRLTVNFSKQLMKKLY